MTASDAPTYWRTRYVDGILLEAGDLSIEQDYYQSRLAFLAAKLGSGVASGLDLVGPPRPSDDCSRVEFALAPGVAIAPTGALLVVPKGREESLAWPLGEGDDERVLTLSATREPEARQRPLLGPAAGAPRPAAGDEEGEVVRYRDGVEAAIHPPDTVPADALPLARLHRSVRDGEIRVEVDTAGTRLAFATVDALAREVEGWRREGERAHEDGRRRLAVTETRLTSLSHRLAADRRDAALRARELGARLGTAEGEVAAVRRRLEATRAQLAAARARLARHVRTVATLVEQVGDGVVDGLGVELGVELGGEGGPTLVVAPGVAVDDHGRGLVVSEAQTLAIDPATWCEPCALALAAAAAEDPGAEPPSARVWAVAADDLRLVLAPPAALPAAAVVIARWHAPDEAGERARDAGPDARRLMPVAANLAHVAETHWWRDGSAWCVGVAFERALAATPAPEAALITVERPNGELGALPGQPALDPGPPPRVFWRFSTHPDYTPAPGDLLRLRMNCAELTDVAGLPVVAALRGPRVVPVAPGGVFETCYRVDGPPAAKGS